LAGAPFSKSQISGTLTTLYNFCAEPKCADGGNPTATVIQASDGYLYGTTQDGASGQGTVFKMSTQGELTWVIGLCPQSPCADGWYPAAPLVQAGSGNIYGTAQLGGLHGRGTIFEITPEGALTTLYNFCAQPNCSDGNDPWGGLVQGNDGSFYGTTLQGGTNDNCGGLTGCGTIFKITPGGTLTTLHDFDGAGGEGLRAGLMQATSGVFYGAPDGGGITNSTCLWGACGSVFALSVGLGPFVETLPTEGKVGEGIRILGTDLTGATGVTFNGVAAAFKVVSPTEIVTRVPTVRPAAL